MPSRVEFQLAASCPEPPSGDGWLYELKHDGHRLAVLSDGRGTLRLLSRNGHERTRLFGPAFIGLVDVSRAFVLDGEIAAPDGVGVTHLDDLQAAIMKRQTHRLVYFAFDLLHLDGHDLRGCALVERKALLAELLATAMCPRIVYVDHVEADGDALLDAVRAVGGEGIVAKRAAGRYRPGLSRDWLKTKCCEVGGFIITGFRDSVPGKLEAVTVAEFVDDELRPAGEVRFGIGRGLRRVLEEIRTGETGRIIRARPELAAEVRFFGRHRSGAIRDGVIEAVERL